MIRTEAIDELHGIKAVAELMTKLEEPFFETEDYFSFRKRVFQVLEAREARLKAGLTEQKGAALIGPAGSGKSRMAREICREYSELAEATGGRAFGSQIVSVVVPGRASIKDTCKEILRALGYPIQGSRDEDYLFQRIVFLMKEERIAALHLDEVQDTGRYKTGDSMELFSKRFRNLMQDREWPICLILTATLEARNFINHDATLTRRLKPIEIRPARLDVEGPLIRKAVTGFLGEVGLEDGGLLFDPRFLRILIHAAAKRFGLVIEIAIEAIGEAVSAGDRSINIDHFADVYFARTNCDDELNPFISSSWEAIDTRKAMDRYIDEHKATGFKRPKKK